MNKSILLVFTLVSMYTAAQTIEIGAGAGTGSYFFIEELDANVDNSYAGAASLFVDLKYNFKDRIDGLKLRFQNTSVNIVGFEYQTNESIDAIIETFTTSILYERLRSDKAFNVGYNFGVGITKQEIEFRRNPFSQRQNSFASITAGGIYSLRLHDKLRLNLETGLLWTDPINTFRGPDNWKTAGEDLSFLAQVGVAYKF